MTLQKFRKCLGIGMALARKYGNLISCYQLLQRWCFYAIASKYLDLKMLDEIEKSFSVLESLRIELFGKLKPGTVYMELHKDFAKKQRVRLEKGGG